MSDKRIVYAEDVIKAVHGLYTIFGSEGEWVDRKDVFEAINSLPPAQPERMKGRWVRKESDLSWWYECSECGESPLFDPYEHEVQSPFCPWCGAKMEVEHG